MDGPLKPFVRLEMPLLDQGHFPVVEARPWFSAIHWRKFNSRVCRALQTLHNLVGQGQCGLVNYSAAAGAHDRYKQWNANNKVDNRNQILIN
ncbi:MAG: hypothetical protein AB8A35_05030 [Prochlorococcus sp.]